MHPEYPIYLSTNNNSITGLLEIANYLEAKSCSIPYNHGAQKTSNSAFCGEAHYLGLGLGAGLLFDFIHVQHEMKIGVKRKKR